MVPICLVPGRVFPNSLCFSHKMRGLLDILSLALALGSVSQPDIPLGTRQPVKGWPKLFHCWMRMCSASLGLCRRRCVLCLRIALPDWIHLGQCKRWNAGMCCAKQPSVQLLLEWDKEEWSDRTNRSYQGWREKTFWFTKLFAFPSWNHSPISSAISFGYTEK